MQAQCGYLSRLVQLVGVLFLTVIVPVSGATLPNVTGPPSYNNWSADSGETLIASWTLTQTYTNVTTTTRISGSPTVYLTTKIGPTATSGDVVVSGQSPVFSGLTLAPATYYLVVGDPGAGQWGKVVSPTVTTGAVRKRHSDEWITCKRVRATAGKRT